MAERYWIETLGCPKNQVDSDKLVGTLALDGFEAADSPEEADLVVVNTCAFIEAARQESIDTVLSLADARHEGARLVVTGCMAERYGDELAEALPEVDLVAPFGAPLTGDAHGGSHLHDGVPTPVTLGTKPTTGPVPAFDLLNLPRPRSSAPWAYVKVAEGCDRNCGFCAIPSFRGKQRSRSTASILTEVDELGGSAGTLSEVVLVAQDLSSFALDRSGGRTVPRIDGPAVGDNRPIVDLVAAVSARVRWTRLLYLYPSTLDDALVDAILATGVPYFDLSLQHVSRPLLKRMRRWGEGDRFLERIRSIRSAEPTAAFRSSFIVGYPGETEKEFDELCGFVKAASFDWMGVFGYSDQEGASAFDHDEKLSPREIEHRRKALMSIQKKISKAKKKSLIGREYDLLLEGTSTESDLLLEGRTAMHAPEIDGTVFVNDYPEGDGKNEDVGPKE